MKFSGAEITIRLLERQGIDTIAGIPGGSNLPLYDALYHSKIRHILARHEQGAGFIAHGIARSTGKTAVTFATSGPGLTNLLTAIADAKLDSVPIIAITGQVPCSMLGTDAFQEVDTYGLTLPITKHNFLVRSAEELLTVIPEAFRIAGSGRPGPVAVDIPKNVQLEQIEIDKWPEPAINESFKLIGKDKLENIAQRIHSSHKPVLYIGGGIIQAEASGLLTELARKNTIPVASTLMGLGTFPPEDPLFLGMLGMHGNRFTNSLLEEADLILAFGVRFDDRATGAIKSFLKNADIVHIDIDRSEIDKLKKTNLSLEGNIRQALETLLPMIQTNERPSWKMRIQEIKKIYPAPAFPDHFHPVNIIRALGNMTSPETIITTDVGQHQMWTTQGYPFGLPRTFLTSGGLGTMGFGLPAAIGAALANPDKKIICISGDGSILMNIQELATLADLGLNIAVILLNNGHLGLVRQQQELFYQNNYIASKFKTSPDFRALAESFGIKGYDFNNREDWHAGLERALAQTGPCFINLPIDQTVNALPMVPPGSSNIEMIGG